MAYKDNNTDRGFYTSQFLLTFSLALLLGIPSEFSKMKNAETHINRTVKSAIVQFPNLHYNSRALCVEEIR